MWSAVAGVILGTVSGFVPGAHPNNLSPFLLFLFPEPWLFAVSFYMSHAVSAPFQSIFLGAGSDANALAIMPGHKLALKGEGLAAFKQASATALLVIITSPLLIPLYYLMIPLKASFGLLVTITLAVLLGWMLAGKQALVTLLAGALGLLCSDQNLLFPMLAGFFGASTLLLNAGPGRLSPQHDKKRNPEQRTVLLSQASAFFFAIIPGASAGVAATASRVFGRLKEREYVSTVAGISAAYTMFSVYTLSAYGITRSGLAVLLKPTSQSMQSLVGASFFAAGTGLLLSWALASKAAGFLHRARQDAVNLASLAVMSYAVILFTGPLGGIVFITSTSIGILAAAARVKRVNCMSAIILPTLLRQLA